MSELDILMQQHGFDAHAYWEADAETKAAMIAPATQPDPGATNKRIIVMIRNFPHHVGDYDADLPEKQCGDDEDEAQDGFRAGWAAAVYAINNRITRMQSKAKDGPQFDAHGYWEADAETKAAMLADGPTYAPLCKCADYTAEQRGRVVETTLPDDARTNPDDMTEEGVAYVGRRKQESVGPRPEWIGMGYQEGRR